MKGIILAGGYGTRLHPLTLSVSKQLLPIYDKPMIYYPLSVLMMAGIREILIITTPEDAPLFKKLLKDGNGIGIKIHYKIQQKPEGLAQAFLIGENFIGKEEVCLILGDNIFYGAHLGEILKDAQKIVKTDFKAVIFGNYVKNPTAYGVATFDKGKNVTDIQEKPEKPASNYAITGLYFYPNDVLEIAKKIRPSKRGELEITDVNKKFLAQKRLEMKLLGRGYAWLDTGTQESLCEATEFIKTVENRTGLKIACLEEIAYQKKWIDAAKISKIAQKLSKSSYGKYLKEICKNEI